ncbi:MAG: RraA family protein [Oscillospiraceae bacterium]|nr:RraA family protein [Oscillospiraceae bacterium]
MDDTKLRERMKALSSSALSDALDQLGAPGELYGIKRMCGSGTVCGPAYTASYEAFDGKGGLGDFVGNAAPGQILVLDNRGRTDCSVWGDLTSLYASVRGIEAVVIDGAFRDVDGVERTGFPVFSRGSSMTTGKGRVKFARSGVAVTVCGKTIRPGDWIFGDGSGVLVIPAVLAERACELAEARERRDELIAQAVRSGIPLSEALRNAVK